MLRHLLSVPCACLAAAFLPSQTATHCELLSRTTRPGTAGYSGVWGYHDPASGRELALVCLREGTWVVDATDPRQPVERGFFPGPVTTFNREVTTFRQFAYVISEAGGGMQILDLRNPLLPVLANTVTLPGWTNTHTVSVDHAAGTLWCSGTSLGLLVWDVAADPVNPRLLTTWTSRYVHDTFTKNGLAWLSLVVDGDLWLADTTSLPALPVLTRLPTPMGRTHTAWTDSTDSLLLVSADVVNGPLQLYDVTNRALPRPLGSYVVPGQDIHTHILTDDKLSHVACIGGDYRVVDVSDPNAPREFASYNGIGAWSAFPFQPSGVIYVSDIVPSATGGGLLCLRLTCGAPERYGAGTAGSGGHVPDADWTGNVARVGNGGFRLVGKRLLGGSPAWLLLGTAAASADVLGIKLLVNPAPPFLAIATTASGSQPGEGVAAVPAPIPNDPALAGGTIHAQWIVADPGGPLGLAASGGRKIAICP
jgi:hypothetical protein